LNLFVSPFLFVNFKQVHIQAKAGGVVEGYVAVDDFIFGTSTSCKTIPSDAKPGAFDSDSSS
jgi:hypothetical protein